MPPLPATRIADLLQPYLINLPGVADAVEPIEIKRLTQKLEIYLDLLVRWNARTNLTAIREPEAMVTRHFGESLFAARVISPRLKPDATLLDFGSGAGFPGLPIQLFRPDLRVTLAESQNKKASFLREAIRTLGLATEVWASRVESMPPLATFDCVTLRAVDNMQAALPVALQRTATPGWIAILAGAEPALHPQTQEPERFPLPVTDQTYLYLYATQQQP
jgi:16S rRNA (guanine527-N7)-methyltransferase